MEIDEVFLESVLTGATKKQQLQIERLNHESINFRKNQKFL